MNLLKDGMGESAQKRRSRNYLLGLVMLFETVNAGVDSSCCEFAATE